MNSRIKNGGCYIFFPTVNARSIMKGIMEDLAAIEKKMRFMKDFESEEFKDIWEEREDLFAQREFVASHFIF